MISPKELTFIHKTGSFELKVTLTDCKLKLELQDFIQWAVYEKQYTNEDIGYDIHKRLEIDDVFYSFIQQNSEISTNLSQEKLDQITEYPYGTIVKIGDSPRYQINKGGKVTVFSYLKTKLKEIVCESLLCLAKVKQITEFQKNHKNTAKENPLSQMRFNKLRSQNQFLKRQLNSVKVKLETEKSKRQQLESKFTIINEEFLKMRDEIDKEKKELKQLKFQLPLLKYFSKQTNNIITLSDRNNEKYHYFFNVPIPKNQTFIFKVKLRKISYKNVTIGVADYEKQKESENSCMSGNAVCYYGAGYLYPGEKQIGTGLEEGETVQVVVNLAQKSIKWSVNGLERASHSHQILGEARTFYPFIELRNYKDSVQYLSA